MMDRDTKLIAILRRQYHIILTALGENIFRINTEYIFCQLAVNIMWYCRLKIAISLYDWLKDNASFSSQKFCAGTLKVFSNAKK